MLIFSLYNSSTQTKNNKNYTGYPLFVKKSNTNI